ncbi:MAG: adenosine-specific kinase [Methanomassiliicoccales archaeon]|nr:adenosine-specific kinase [Methanomassiliicoccales archaeon]MDD1755277.1 adenosine-specific kinase [Methanomassiliicoccales archaeon]
MKDESPKVELVPVEKPVDANVIIGQTHFIKSAEDLYEAMVNSVPGAKFGVAFCEASGPRLVRVEGNDGELERCATENAMRVGAGHTFFVVMRNAFPVNVLQRIREVPEVCTVFCATANDVAVVVAESSKGRGIIGVIDGQPPLGVETDSDAKERKEFLRKIGYKR